MRAGFLVAVALLVIGLFGFFVWTDGHFPTTYGALAIMRRHDAARAMRAGTRWTPYAAGIAAGLVASAAVFYATCLAM